MGTITPTSMTGTGDRVVNETTMTSSDTFAFKSSARSILVLRNPTGGALTPTIDGDGASTVGVSGVGNVDISSGFALASIPAGDVAAIPLDTISRYLDGTIAITGGTGLVAALLEY